MLRWAIPSHSALLKVLMVFNLKHTQTYVTCYNDIGTCLMFIISQSTCFGKGAFSFCDVLNIVAVNSAKYVTKVTFS